MRLNGPESTWAAIVVALGLAGMAVYQLIAWFGANMGWWG